VVAEIGLNHNGDLDLAYKTIDAAVEAGADSVKFQNYRTEDFIGDRSLTYAYESEGRTIVESQYDMFKRCELTRPALVALKAHCDERGIVFHSTPTSEEGVRDLLEIGAPILKNGSDYLTNVHLIRAMGKTGLTTVLSTGMATLADIDDAVRAFRETGNEQLILLHCTSSYPTTPEDVHLRKMATLGAAFQSLVGFSDHTAGTTAAIGAVALGACWIEKHFTLDKSLPGPDHRFSADLDEFRTLVNGVRTVEQCLGTAIVGPTESEAQGRRDFRLSCAAARDLPAGHRLTDRDVAFRRPGVGLPPKDVSWVVGRRTARRVKAGEVFTSENME
jgi:N-acetylneuraminate synthase/N,N'-diacetyllegionaminate synthase